MSSFPLSKPLPKAGFINTQFQPLLYNPLYNMGSTSNEEVHLASTGPNFYTRNLKSMEEEERAETYGMGKSAAMVLEMQAAAAAAAAAQEEQMGGGTDQGMKRWSSYEHSMSPLMEIANDNNNLLSRSGAAVDFLPLSNNGNTPYNLEAAKYNTQDMEILRIKQPLHTSSASVQQHLYEQLPSSLTHPPSLGISASFLANFHTHTPAPPPPSSSYSDHHLQLLGDHHHHPHPQWPSASHPHAELLLLPGVSDHASPALHSHSAALPSSKLDLLHASSLHDKQAPLQQLPFGMGAPAGGTGTGEHLPSAAQMWHIDKLDMAVGLGLRDHAAATRSVAMFPQDVDHFGSARHGHTQSAGLSLFLQSPQQRAQTALSLDAARYSARSATGSVGVLRNSKYLKAAQQLLNEFCNVCKDGIPEGKSSMQAGAGGLQPQQNIWSTAAGGISNGEENGNSIAGDDHHAHLLHRALFSATQKDMSLYSNEHYKGSIDQSKQFKQISDHHHQQENPHGEIAPPSPAHLDTAPPHKQLPADERCHLQMRKARLIAMVEELDRRYQQYRDQMQLIVTSFESATGMGAAAAYTTLARKAMSRQFRGLRDAISDHIRKVCKMLGEEVSSVPILSRGETPRLRLVDQRLRHQRSLQQIGMLPQQQAWRPQRGLPERSVSVLRAWLFEHFLHPYPKDSEKSMLARLTGLSRNQVSNWFINARVRLWKPMIEEMYVEESKALELSEAEASHAAAEVMQGISAGDQSTNIPSDQSSRQSWQQAASTPTPAPASSFNNPGPAISLYNTRPLHRDDLNSFMHLHSSANANDAHVHAPHAEAVSSHQYSWMKGMHAEHAGDIGVLTHQHDQMSLQAAAFMQGQLNASMKNGVSLTLGLQQPPPHSSYNAASSAYGRPSEALLF